MSLSAGGVRQQLAGVALTSTGSHKDQSDKYRAILDQILLAGSASPELIDNLKALVDQSKGILISLLLIDSKLTSFNCSF